MTPGPAPTVRSPCRFHVVPLRLSRMVYLGECRLDRFESNNLGVFGAYCRGDRPDEIVLCFG